MFTPPPGEDMEMSSPHKQDQDLDFDIEDSIHVTDDEHMAEDDGSHIHTATDATMGDDDVLTEPHEAEMHDPVESSAQIPLPEEDEDALIDYDDEELDTTVHEETQDVPINDAGEDLGDSAVHDFANLQHGEHEGEILEGDNTVAEAQTNEEEWAEETLVETAEHVGEVEGTEGVAHEVSDDLASATGAETEELGEQYADEHTEEVQSSVTEGVEQHEPDEHAQEEEASQLTENVNQNYTDGHEDVQSGATVDQQAAAIDAEIGGESDTEYVHDYPPLLTDTGLHPIVVHFAGQDIALFKSNNHPGGLLTDDNLINQSMANLMEKCKESLIARGEQLPENMEVVFQFHGLNLMIYQTSREVYACSMNDVLDLFLELHHNDAYVHPPPMSVTLKPFITFEGGMAILKAAVAQGNGMHYLNQFEGPQFHDEGQYGGEEENNPAEVEEYYDEEYDENEYYEDPSYEPVTEMDQPQEDHVDDSFGFIADSAQEHAPVEESAQYLEGHDESYEVGATEENDGQHAAGEELHQEDNDENHKGDATEETKEPAETNAGPDPKNDEDNANNDQTEVTTADNDDSFTFVEETEGAETSTHGPEATNGNDETTENKPEEDPTNDPKFGASDELYDFEDQVESAAGENGIEATKNGYVEVAIPANDEDEDHIDFDDDTTEQYEAKKASPPDTAASTASPGGKRAHEDLEDDIDFDEPEAKKPRS